MTQKPDLSNLWDLTEHLAFAISFFPERASSVQPLYQEGQTVGATPQIADWLEKLGLSEYAERFAENDIDTSVLRDLTDQDLKELGVSLGHRRKMLRAIAELGSAPAAPPAPAEPPVTPAPLAVAPPPSLLP